MPHSVRDPSFTTLVEAARLLDAGEGQDECLRRILDRLERDLGGARATVMLLSPDGADLRVEAAGAVADGQADARLRPGEGITGEVLASGRPAVIPRIADEPRFAHRVHRRSATERDHAFVCVPILFRARPIGTLALDLPPAGVEDLRTACGLLEVVAALIAHDAHLRRQAAEERQALEGENLRLRERLGEDRSTSRIIGVSPALREVRLRIAQVAAGDTTVLLQGESGTGKERAAEALHFASRRAAGPFVRVNCGALNEHLLDSELFGHEKGAFTGAAARRIGCIEQAAGGTLFLDEIGELALLQTRRQILLA